MAQWVMTWCCHCSGSGSIPSLFRMPQVQEKKLIHKNDSFQPAPSGGHLSGQLAQGPQDRGKRKPYQKKRKYELGCLTSNSDNALHHKYIFHVEGGIKNYLAFSWGSGCCTQITDVVYNVSNNKVIHTKVPGEEQHWACWQHTRPTAVGVPLHCPWATRRGGKLTPEEEEVLNKEQSKKIEKKYDEGKRMPKSAVF